MALGHQRRDVCVRIGPRHRDRHRRGDLGVILLVSPVISPRFRGPVNQGLDLTQPPTN